MSQRQEFLTLHKKQSMPFAELCRRFGISRKTGYKWLARGDDLSDRARRPHSSPSKTPAAIEERVVALRREHPVWGGRKIAARLTGELDGHVLQPSTVTHILRRHGLIGVREPGAGGRYRRFEHPYPNSLWQIDFKGDFALGGNRCHPLTVLDDHSRYNIVLKALTSQRSEVVQPCLEAAFRRYGLPDRINADNGAPWGCPRSPGESISTLTMWLVRLGVRVTFSAPGHPQTNGKDERFHRSLKAEVLAGRSFTELTYTQRLFDDWRHVYNHERPHDALGLAVPASRYKASQRPFPNRLPEIEYSPIDQVIRVGWNGQVRFQQRELRVSSALRNNDIAFRPVSNRDGAFDVFFCHHKLMTVDLNESGEAS